MTKTTTKPKPVKQVFDDLENYLLFCKDYGYRFDESDLYNDSSFAYRQYKKFLTKKDFKDQWELDRIRFKEE